MNDFRVLYNGKNPVTYRFIDRQSAETVVFVHGLFSSSSIFRHFAETIDKNIILVELRGIVESAIRSPFIEGYVEDIRLILEKEKIDRDIILVGYSLGCAIANRFAENGGQWVKKVIMLSPINRTIHEIGEARFAKALIEGLGSDFFKKWKEYRNLENHWPFYRIFSLFNLRLLREAYRQIEFTAKVPIIILNGVKDIFFDFADKRLQAKNIIHQTIEGLDHYLFLTRERIAEVGQKLRQLI
jgi:pimeloyl-ACP methyl ester carboxylesterase